jgi:hypothetical protein
VIPSSEIDRISSSPSLGGLTGDKILTLVNFDILRFKNTITSMMKIPKDLNSRRALHNIVEPGSSLAPTECSNHAHIAVDSCSAPPGRSSGKISYCVYCGAMEKAQAKTQTTRGAMDLFRFCRLSPLPSTDCPLSGP